VVRTHAKPPDGDTIGSNRYLSTAITGDNLRVHGWVPDTTPWLNYRYAECWLRRDAVESGRSGAEITDRKRGVCLFADAGVRVRLGVTVPETRPTDEFPGRPTVAIFGAAVEVR